MISFKITLTVSVRIYANIHQGEELKIQKYFFEKFQIWQTLCLKSGRPCQFDFKHELAQRASTKMTKLLVQIYQIFHQLGSARCNFEGLVKFYQNLVQFTP
jgi:hypothetical protein